MGLALFKVTEYWKQHGLQGSRLLFVLIKDQVIYFMVSVLAISTFKEAMLMLSRAICIAAFAIAENEIPASLVLSNIVLSLGSPALLCILGSRMFFNLKEAAEHGVNVGTNRSSNSHSEIRFDEPGSGQAQYVVLRVTFTLMLIPA